MLRSYYSIFTEEEDGGYSVTFDEFNGGTQGDDLEEAMTNAREFLAGILAYYIEENIPLPERVDHIHPRDLSENQFVTLIQADPTPYIKNKTIRKNVTIPEWLAVRAENDKANFSKILTDSLFEKYG